MNRRILYLVVPALACSHGAQAPAPRAQPAAAVTVAPARTGYAPGTFRYRAISRTHQLQEIEGNRQEGNYALELLGTATIAAEGARTRFAFVLDSIRAEGGLITPADISRGRGITLSGVLAPDGQVSELTGDSVLTGQLMNVATSVKNFFPRLPAGGAQPGQSWTDTTDTKTAGAAQLSIHSINNRRAVEWIQQSNHRALHIEVNSVYTITGTGQQMGQDFTINGSGARMTQQWVSADGIYLGANAHDSSTVTIALTAMGMSFPSMQVRSDTVSLIP